MWSFTKWIPSKEDVEAELHALQERYGPLAENGESPWDPTVAFGLGFQAGMGWGAKRSRGARHGNGVAPALDVDILNRERTRYFARPALNMNESEEVISGFAAGFFRGLAWETAKGSDPPAEIGERAPSQKAA